MHGDLCLTFSHDLNTWLLGWPGDWLAITPQEARNAIDARKQGVAVLLLDAI
ncbi:MAG: hypothetical protein QG602_3938 [Verrucomicrobiota bacterium]|nr:hypothetical protein [Verrucomicrobiota bacterium]